MEIFQFINSKDVANYLREIDYKFSPEEATYLIHEARNVPLAQKHAAYRELIKSNPAYPLKERREGVFRNQTLASFLTAYMERENALVEECKRAGDHAVYFASYFSKADNCWSESDIYDTVYSSFDECFAETLQEDDDDVAKLKIHKKFVETNRLIVLELLPDGSALQAEEFRSDACDEQILHAFEWMWIKLPTPFKRGDILVPLREKTYRDYNREEQLIVLTELCTWGSRELKENGYRNAKKPNPNIGERNFAWYDGLIARHEREGDPSDMWFHGFFAAKDGSVYHDHTVALTYLDYELYRGELTGKQRILTAVSNYLKGKIGIELLLRAHRAIVLEEELDDLKAIYRSWFSQEELALAGLQDVESIN